MDKNSPTEQAENTHNSGRIKDEKRAERQDRLSQALKQNLARRKALKRARKKPLMD